MYTMYNACRQGVIHIYKYHIAYPNNAYEYLPFSIFLNTDLCEKEKILTEYWEN